jgi:Aminoglycoside-2''-adenylyltransferase
MGEQETRQLNALGEVADVLEGARIAYWLFGGWAVDFHAGSVTRAHDDIDIAVWLEDVPMIAQLLEANSWQHVPSEDDNGGTGFERGGVRLELTYLVPDRDGRVFIPLRAGPVPWSRDLFGGDVRELLGVSAHVVGLEPLTLGKSSPRDDLVDAAKDRADFSVLARLVQTPGDDSSDEIA